MHNGMLASAIALLRRCRFGLFLAILAPCGGCTASLPTIVVKKEKLSGDEPHLPDEIKAKYRGKTITCSYKICITADGTMDRVIPISSIPGADDAIMYTLIRWTYRPQGVPVCFIENFQFNIE